MQKFAWILVGLLAGVLIATSVPVGAHHRRSATRLANRVERLENQIATLQNKTFFMDSDGFYMGPVFGEQVLGFCQAGTAATWEVTAFTPDAVWIDDCFVGQQQRDQLLQDFSR